MKKHNCLGAVVITAALILILAFTPWTGAMARPISRQQAQQQAAHFLQQRGDASRLKAAEAYPKGAFSPTGRRSPVNPNDDVQPYYVFDRGNQEGYVIVAGDDELNESILGYCNHGSFVYDEMPPNMLSWLEGYVKEIQDFQASRNAGTQQCSLTKRRLPTHPAIKPLMKSKWSQDSPYNDECPMYFTLGRSVTGCVATAYAQILYYHRSKMVTETQAAMPAYDTWNEHETFGHLHVEGIPKGSPIDWDHMTDTYSNNSTGLQKTAVAQLMHYCGVAVKMEYTNEESGAQSAAVYDALRNYFGFGNSVKYVTDKSDEEWDQLIYNELANQRPVYISGSNDSGGHAFVCDGYDGNGLFHINWGWGGQSDDYYLLTKLTPGQQGIGGSDHGYTDYRECIIGIEPENYHQRTMPFADATAKRLCTAAWDQDGDGVLSYGEAALVTDLGTVLKGQTIRSFAELRYFTALTAISDEAFSGCQQLTTVLLPRNVQRIGARAFKDCKKLSSIDMPISLQYIGEEAFSGCTTLAISQLPATIKSLEARAFQGCANLTTLTLPATLTHIGDEAFSGCRFSEMTVSNLMPQNITMGQNVFSECPVATAELHILQGTRSWFEGDEQWRQFGTIKEHRNRTKAQFIPLTPNTQVYLYHVGTGRFLSKGEAWGTQAVVTDGKPMLFQLKHSSSMPEGVYALYSNDTGNDRHYIFRTYTDSNVGNGVRASFVDGSLDQRAHWLVTDVGNDTYTLSIPSDYNDYNAACRWGVQTNHKSQFVQPTWGVYSDIAYDGNESDCQWRFISYDADCAASYEEAVALENLVNKALASRVPCQDEQAVLDNMQSTIDEMRQAQRSLRQKMQLIDFADDLVRQTCQSEFDIDLDGEISLKEASMTDSESFGKIYFTSKPITSFDELQYFTSVKELYGNSFENCTKLTSIILPESIERIYYRVFRNCSKLTSINLPEYIITIGSLAFGNCTQLKTVRIDSPAPQNISVASDAFSGVNLKNVVLQVPVGTKELYAAAPVWRNFGTIEEVRTRTQPQPSSVYEGARGYVMNVATRKMITSGEAYGTQGVVGRSGFIYEWCRTGNMPEGQFYLKNTATGKVLFRTDTDSKVGKGVKACFIDGDLSDKAYWQLDSVAPCVYTLQVPKGAYGYVEGEYLGTNYEHQSDYTSTIGYTSGLYWDIAYEKNERQCQWVFISLDDIRKADEIDKNVMQLKNLLQKAEQKGGIDTAEEQAVYDNLLSSDADITAAIASLRAKLHYIDISDQRAKDLCLENWDSDRDGELSLEEAAAVTDLGEVFRNQTLVKNLDFLRHFTALQAIPANAFRNANSLTTVYLPEQVKSIGEMAFTGTPLRFLVVMNAEAMLSIYMPGIRQQATVFVPESLVSTYQESDVWSKYTITAYTGKPVVTALPATRVYGRSTGKLEYVVTGAPVDGEPVLQCDELTVPTTPVGEYAIRVLPGTITSSGLECREGVFTVTPATLIITAQSYTRKVGEANPQFEFTVRGFRNKETVEVFLTQPVITCEATTDSPAGQYPITVSGASAQNYEMTYEDGVLTIEGSSGITSVKQSTAADGNYYDMQGRRVTSTKRRGLYIDRERRRVVVQ